MEIELPYNYAPRNYQIPAWEHFEGAAERKRGICVWHRRAGKDLFAINMIGTKVFERRGLYWHLLPTYKQGRAIVWNGFTRDGVRFLDHFPEELVADRNKSEMKVTFTNGSIYQVVGTDNIDLLVGTNPIGCVFSEYSLHDPGAWDYLRPILAENGGWALFIYTARGRNHGYDLLEMSKKNRTWFSQVLVAGNEGTKKDDGTPVIPDEVIQEEREAGMPEELIQQEFFCSFDAPCFGAYYGKSMAALLEQGRIPDQDLWEPRLPVHTSWDLGIDDETVIWFFQEYGNEIRVIDFMEDSGEALSFYVRGLRGQLEDCRHRAAYTYGTHYFPHDIEVRELSSGKSRKEHLKELGVKVKVVKKHDVIDGIDVVRNMLPKCWFSNTRCARGVEAMRQYRKEWDDKKKTFKSSPFHDWASHFADSFRMFAMGRRVRPKKDRKPQQRQLDKKDYLRT